MSEDYQGPGRTLPASTSAQDGQVLTLDSSQENGTKWATAGGGLPPSTSQGDLLAGNTEGGFSVLVNPADSGEVLTIIDGAGIGWRPVAGAGDTTTLFSHQLTYTPLPADNDGIFVPIGSSNFFPDDPAWATIVDVNPDDHAGVQLTKGLYSVQYQVGFDATTTGNAGAFLSNSGNENGTGDGLILYSVASMPKAASNPTREFTQTVMVSDDEAPLIVWINAVASAGSDGAFGHLVIVKLG